jgi:multidrug transporter EmrE-like cation transporter
MVLGVFLGRWSLPLVARGTSGIRADILNAPHLVIWAIIAGCLWSVANTLTIFAIRDLGLSIAFPLWNTNALIGILWGVLFFGELKGAGWIRWATVCGRGSNVFWRLGAGASLSRPNLVACGHSRDSGCPGRRRTLGNDVYPVP